MYSQDNQQTLKNRLPPHNRSGQYKQPIFIEDPIGEEGSSASDSTSMYSNPNNYSTVKKTNSTTSTLFNREIKFTPKFFDTPLAEKRYKNSQTYLSSKSQIPSVSVHKQIMKKVIKNLSQFNKKPAYIFTTKQTDESTPEKWYIADEIVYSQEDSFEENYYDFQKYPVFTVTAPYSGDVSEESNLLDSELQRFEAICKEARMGLRALTTYDCSTKPLDNSSLPQEIDSSQVNLKVLRNSDLVYLNMFRIFTIIMKSESQQMTRYKIQKLVYFPNVNFTLHALHSPFKLVSSPLVTLLTKKSDQMFNNTQQYKRPAIKFGFLSLANTQRLLPLAASDPLCSQVPIIGLWIHGISSKMESLEKSEEEKNLLLGFLFEYINNTNIKNRYSFDHERKTFLLLVFAEDSSKFYEVEFDESCPDPETDNKWLLLRHTCDIIDEKEIINHSHWNFNFSKHLITPNLDFIRKPFPSVTPSQSSKSTPFQKKTKAKEDSLSQYLTGGRQSSPSEHELDEELDTYDANYPNFHLPKPQPMPVIRLEDSQNSQKTATFVQEHTFSNEMVQVRGGLVGQNVLTESIKKWNGTPNSSHQHNSMSLNNFSIGSGKKNDSLMSNKDFKEREREMQREAEREREREREKERDREREREREREIAREKESAFMRETITQQNEMIHSLRDQISSLQSLILSLQSQMAIQQQIQMAPNISISSPNFTPMATGKFPGLRNNLSARNLSSVKKDFSSGEEFTLDCKTQCEAESQRFLQEIQQAKQAIKSDNKPPLNDTQPKFRSVNEHIMQAETTMRSEHTMRNDSMTMRTYDPNAYDLGSEFMTQRNNAMTKEAMAMQARIDLERLSLSKIERVDEGNQYEDTIELDERGSTKITPRTKEQEAEHQNILDQRILREITNDIQPMRVQDLRSSEHTTQQTIPKPETSNSRQDNSRNDSSINESHNTSKHDRSMDLPKPSKDSFDSKTYLRPVPQNEGTIDSMISDKEVYRMKIPEDSLLASTRDDFLAKIQQEKKEILREQKERAENKENDRELINKLAILPPLEGRNNSIKIPKIKFDSKLVDSDSEEEELVNKLVQTRLAKNKLLNNNF